MRKLFVIVLLLTVSITQAQKHKKALQLADKLSTVMKLSTEDNAKLLELILERNKSKAKFRKQFGNDKVGFKVEAKKVEKEYNKNLRALVGNEKMQLLKKYRKSQREIKKKN